MLDQLAIALAAEAKDGHLPEQAVLFLDEWPGDIGVRLVGFYRLLVVDQDEGPTGVSDALKQGQGTSCDQALLRVIFWPSGRMTKSLAASNAALRRSLIEEPEGREGADFATALTWRGRDKSPNGKPIYHPASRTRCGRGQPLAQ